MSYSTAGYMHCEPFVYWGDLHADWAEYVRNVDVGDFLWKFRYMDEALGYLDKVQFVPNPHYEISGIDELCVEWFLSRRGEISLYSPNDWWERTVLFPLSRNSFPFAFLTEKQIDDLIEQEGEDYREDILEDLPGPFAGESELEEYVRENFDAGEEYENLGLWNLNLRTPDPYYEKELEVKNFCGDGHIGSDALLEFLAKAGVVNRDLRDWMVSYHLTGEDGEEFTFAKKIVGNQVVDPHERRSSW